MVLGPCRNGTNKINELFTMPSAIVFAPFVAVPVIGENTVTINNEAGAKCFYPQLQYNLPTIMYQKRIIHLLQAREQN
jgi:hypothetical protein